MDHPAVPAVIHATPMRTQYRRLLPKGRARPGMNNHGHRNDRTPITDVGVEAMADEAECGCEVETLLRRRAGGRRWDRRQPVPVRAAGPGTQTRPTDPGGRGYVSVSEVIRRAIGEYLRASWPSPGPAEPVSRSPHGLED
jgi:hypothetical protein